MPIRYGQCAADKDHLGDETTAGCLVNPSIYTNYGLSHRDFFTVNATKKMKTHQNCRLQPREASVIRKLFENLGYEFPENSFEELWKKGVEIDRTGFVCIETFKNLINQMDVKKSQ